MSDPVNFNYAHYAGIESVPAAVVFAVLYVPLFVWYARQSISRPTTVFIMLAFFSIVRVTAFTTRAVLAGVDSAAESRNFFIANQIIYSIGFVGLLWSAYTLVLDRELVSDAEKPSGPISGVARNRRLYHLALTIAVVLNIVGTINLTSANAKQSDITLGNNLRKASIIIFLVLVCLLVYLTVMFAVSEARIAHSYRRGNDSVGMIHGTKFLGLIAVLLLAREIFMIATISDPAKQQREVYWYPLSATTELLAVCLFLTPDLVPPRSELPK